MLGTLGFPLGHQAGLVGMLVVTLSPEEKHYVSQQKQKHTADKGEIRFLHYHFYTNLQK